MLKEGFVHFELIELRQNESSCDRSQRYAREEE